MINHIFISLSGVQKYDVSYIHLYNVFTLLNVYARDPTYMNFKEKLRNNGKERNVPFPESTNQF